METRFFIDNGNRTAWRKTWFWQLGNWWIYYILSNYNTFSTLPYSLRATSCKWMRHLEKVAANSFRQSRLWLPRKLPHRKARCIFTHSAVFSIFSCIKWHIFKIILIVVKCWYDYWKKTYGKNIVLYKAGLTTISTLSSQGDLGSTKYFGCKGPFNSPHLCTAFKWKVDLQEKLVGGTFIKEQMHNFKIVYAEARSPCCTQGSHNNGKYSVNLDPHPGTTHYSNTYFGFFRFSHCFLTKCVSAASLKMLYLLTNCDSDPTLEILTRKGKLLGNHTLKGKSHDTAFRWNITAFYKIYYWKQFWKTYSISFVGPTRSIASPTTSTCTNASIATSSGPSFYSSTMSLTSLVSSLVTSSLSLYTSPSTIWWRKSTIWGP